MIGVRDRQRDCGCRRCLSHRLRPAPTSADGCPSFEVSHGARRPARIPRPGPVVPVRFDPASGALAAEAGAAIRGRRSTRMRGIADMMLVPNYLDRSPIHGIGIFARDFIPKGTSVWEFTPGCDQVFSDEELAAAAAHPARDHSVLLLCRTGARGQRCSAATTPGTSTTPMTPNCGPGDHVVDGYVSTVALRDIAAGEELTYSIEEDADAGRKLGAGETETGRRCAWLCAVRHRSYAPQLMRPSNTLPHCVRQDSALLCQGNDGQRFSHSGADRRTVRSRSDLQGTST